MSSQVIKPGHHHNHHVGVASRKRKDRDDGGGGGGAFAATTAQPIMMANKKTEPTPSQLPQTKPQPQPTELKSAANVCKKTNNWLLAGYMAHEFLNQGTLLGQKWDPARAVASPVTPRSSNHSVIRRGGPPGEAEAKAAPARPQPQKVIHGSSSSSYAEVTALLMKSSEGAHIDGIVNPTQLASWLHL